MDERTSVLGRARAGIIEHGTELWGLSLETGKELAVRVHGGARELSTVLRHRYEAFGEHGRKVLDDERFDRLRSGAAELVEKIRSTARSRGAGCGTTGGARPPTTTTSESSPADVPAAAWDHDA